MPSSFVLSHFTFAFEDHAEPLFSDTTMTIPPTRVGVVR